jgi:asparagine synthetase B (glutamine-hydrolysing)
MSILFGEWNFDRRPVDPEVLSSADALLEPYAPDAHSQYKGGGIVLTYYALHTTAESRLEKQPFVSASGAVFTWDGRLDNREELIRELRDNLTKATDVEIVAVTFARWGTSPAFAHCITWSRVERQDGVQSSILW